MAQLISLALETHPRMGSCFVIRFSWNRLREDPVAQVKALPADDREYDAAQRSWWVAARQADRLSLLFDNWDEHATLLASTDPTAFSAVAVGALRERIVSAADAVLDAMPATSGDEILAAVGEAVGAWLDRWRRAAPDAAAAVSPARLGDVRELARALRADLPTWALRAAFTRELLARDRRESGPPDE